MMNKKFAVICLVLICLLLPAFSAACNSNEITASLGSQFMLTTGKSAVITGQSLKIKFVEVTGDSRCPTGVQCIQAGDAKCLMLINYNDSESSLTLVQEGGNEINTIDFNIYKFSFRLEPYPVSDKQIALEDYRLIMTVTKTEK
jgi:hypothetical protein